MAYSTSTKSSSGTRLIGRLHGAPSQSERSFWRLLLRTSIMAGLLYAAFVVLFYALGVTALARVNIASVLLYALICVLLSRSGARFYAFGLFVFEIQAHAVLASYLIGWDAGFHYYAIIAIPIITLANYDSQRTKGAAIIGLITLMVATDTLLRDTAPVHVLPGYILDALHYINLTALLTILALIVAFYSRLITHTEHKLRKLATTDPLTGLLNRRSMIEIWQLELATQRRSGNPLSLILCDIDNFKQVNDTHGHEVGDQVLRAVSNTLSKGIRQSDHVARWGGEEFLILMIGAPIGKAERLAHQLRKAIGELVVPVDEHELTIALTFGVTEIPAHAPHSQEAAIARADAALYAGKHAGRDCVRCHPHESTETLTTNGAV